LIVLAGLAATVLLVSFVTLTNGDARPTLAADDKAAAARAGTVLGFHTVGEAACALGAALGAYARILHHDIDTRVAERQQATGDFGPFPLVVVSRAGGRRFPTDVAVREALLAAVHRRPARLGLADVAVAFGLARA
jgi:hypothetical protein